MATTKIQSGAFPAGPAGKKIFALYKKLISRMKNS